MKFTILNRDNIQYIVPNVNFITISMTEPENVYPPPPETNNCLNYLRLTFTDEDNVADARISNFDIEIYNFDY